MLSVIITSFSNVFEGTVISLEVLVDAVFLVVRLQLPQIIQEREILFGILLRKYGEKYLMRLISDMIKLKQ